MSNSDYIAKQGEERLRGDNPFADKSFDLFWQAVEEDVCRVNGEEGLERTKAKGLFTFAQMRAMAYGAYTSGFICGRNQS